jgi:hypothetical protein
MQRDIACSARNSGKWLSDVWREVQPPSAGTILLLSTVNNRHNVAFPQSLLHNLKRVSYCCG